MGIITTNCIQEHSTKVLFSPDGAKQILPTVSTVVEETFGLDKAPKQWNEADSGVFEDGLVPRIPHKTIRFLRSSSDQDNSMELYGQSSRLINGLIAKLDKFNSAKASIFFRELFRFNKPYYVNEFSFKANKYRGDRQMLHPVNLKQAQHEFHQLLDDLISKINRPDCGDHLRNNILRVIYNAETYFYNYDWTQHDQKLTEIFKNSTNDLTNVFLEQYFKKRFDSLDDGVKQILLNSLESKNRMSSDLAYLLIDSMQAPQQNHSQFLKELSSKTVDEIINDIDNLSLRACNTANLSDLEINDEKFGFEIELKSMVNEYHENSQDSFRSILSLTNSDQFFEQTIDYPFVEFQTKGGFHINPKISLKLIKFVKNLQSHPELNYFESQHLHLDCTQDQIDSVISGKRGRVKCIQDNILGLRSHREPKNNGQRTFQIADNNRFDQSRRNKATRAQINNNQEIEYSFEASTMLDKLIASNAIKSFEFQELDLNDPEIKKHLEKIDFLETESFENNEDYFQKKENFKLAVYLYLAKKNHRTEALASILRLYRSKSLPDLNEAFYFRVKDTFGTNPINKIIDTLVQNNKGQNGYDLNAEILKKALTNSHFFYLRINSLEPENLDLIKKLDKVIGHIFINAPAIFNDLIASKEQILSPEFLNTFMSLNNQEFSNELFKGIMNSKSLTARDKIDFYSKIFNQDEKIAKQCYLILSKASTQDLLKTKFYLDNNLNMEIKLLLAKFCNQDIKLSSEATEEIFKKNIKPDLIKVLCNNLSPAFLQRMVNDYINNNADNYFSEIIKQQEQDKRSLATEIICNTAKEEYDIDYITKCLNNKNFSLDLLRSLIAHSMKIKINNQQDLVSLLKDLDKDNDLNRIIANSLLLRCGPMLDHNKLMELIQDKELSSTVKQQIINNTDSISVAQYLDIYKELRSLESNIDFNKKLQSRLENITKVEPGDYGKLVRALDEAYEMEPFDQVYADQIDCLLRSCSRAIEIKAYEDLKALDSKDLLQQAENGEIDLKKFKIDDLISQIKLRVKCAEIEERLVRKNI